MIAAIEPLLDARLGYLLLGLFGVLWVALGVWLGRNVTTYEGFAVAGRNVGLALGAATAVATWITSNTTMVAPQLALQYGVWGMLAYSTASFGLLAFAPMAMRIRRLMPEGYTAVEFMRRRYGRPGGIPFFIVSVFYALIWLITMAMAGGKLLEVLSGIPYETGLTVVMTVCVLYTLFGGMYAVIGTDYIQSVIIVIGLVVVGIAVLVRIGLGEVHAELEVQRPMLLGVLFPAAVMTVFNSMLFGFGEIFHSNVWWSRALAIRESVGGRAFLLGGFIWLPIPILAGFLGLAAPALGVGISQPDAAGPLVAAHVLGGFGAVVVFVIIFCSLASSIDSLLAATGDLLAHDIVLPLVRQVGHQPSEWGKRVAAGGCVVAISLLAWGVSLLSNTDLVSVLFLAGPLVASCIWPILGGLYYCRPGPWAAAAAILGGSAAGLAAYCWIGDFCGALVGAATSGVVFGLATLASDHGFDFSSLQNLDDLPGWSAGDEPQSTDAEVAR